MKKNEEKCGISLTFSFIRDIIIMQLSAFAEKLGLKEYGGCIYVAGRGEKAF